MASFMRTRAPKWYPKRMKQLLSGKLFFGRVRILNAGLPPRREARVSLWQRRATRGPVVTGVIETVGECPALASEPVNLFLNLKIGVGTVQRTVGNIFVEGSDTFPAHLRAYWGGKPRREYRINPQPI
jgi:hypothetical protein